MQTPVKWGILSTGNIARAYARAVRETPEAALAAVGSRTQAAADAFGDEYDVPHRHASYEALVQDPTVDAVYIGTPHPLHYENTIAALEAGKHVVCEKPLTLNAKQAAEVIGLARSRGLFFMDAMWTRFIPAVVKLRELLAEGVLGELRHFNADFSVNFPYDTGSRFFDPALGGGALLDLGVYPVAFASMVFGGPPAEIATLAHIGPTGVDHQMSAVFRYDNGALASFTCGFEARGHRQGVIAGTRGYIHIDAPLHHPDSFRLVLDDQQPVPFSVPALGNPYRYEAAAASRSIQQGRTECAEMPLDETLQIMQTMDRIRAIWGMSYPGE